MSELHPSLSVQRTMKRGSLIFFPQPFANLPDQLKVVKTEPVLAEAGREKIGLAS